MNPDKLFDYLDDRLPAAERAALEERLMLDVHRSHGCQRKDVKGSELTIDTRQQR